jgi:HSP20 family molecular chaperone IbpA
MFPWNKQFPFDQSSFTQHFNKMNPKEVENYIQTVMKNVFGGDFSQGFPFQGEPSQNDNRVKSSKPPKPEIFETNDYVYVKLPVEMDDVENIKIQHTNHQLIVNNYPKQSEQNKFMLPSPVKRKGTRARYVEGYLEIQFLRLHEHTISEVDITY